MGGNKKTENDDEVPYKDSPDATYGRSGVPVKNCMYNTATDEAMVRQSTDTVRDSCKAPNVTEKPEGFSDVKKQDASDMPDSGKLSIEDHAKMPAGEVDRGQNECTSVSTDRKRGISTEHSSQVVNEVAQKTCNVPPVASATKGEEQACYVAVQKKAARKQRPSWSISIDNWKRARHDWSSPKALLKTKKTKPDDLVEDGIPEYMLPTFPPSVDVTGPAAYLLPKLQYAKDHAEDVSTFLTVMQGQEYAAELKNIKQAAIRTHVLIDALVSTMKQRELAQEKSRVYPITALEKPRSYWDQRNRDDWEGRPYPVCSRNDPSTGWFYLMHNLYHWGKPSVVDNLPADKVERPSPKRIPHQPVTRTDVDASALGREVLDTVLAPGKHLDPEGSFAISKAGKHGHALFNDAYWEYQAKSMSRPSTELYQGRDFKMLAGQLSRLHRSSQEPAKLSPKNYLPISNPHFHGPASLKLEDIAIRVEYRAGPGNTKVQKSWYGDLGITEQKYYMIKFRSENPDDPDPSNRVKVDVTGRNIQIQFVHKHTHTTVELFMQQEFNVHFGQSTSTNFAVSNWRGTKSNPIKLNLCSEHGRVASALFVTERIKAVYFEFYTRTVEPKERHASDYDIITSPPRMVELVHGTAWGRFIVIYCNDHSIKGKREYKQTFHSTHSFLLFLQGLHWH